MKEPAFSAHVANAAKWAAAAEIAAKLLSPVTSMLLARLLMPEVFGIVAVITMLVSFGDTVLETGFRKYLVQRNFRRKEDMERFAQTVLWISLVLACLFWIGVTVFSKGFTNRFGGVDITALTAVAGVQLPLMSYSGILAALCRRRLDFKTLFAARVTCAAVPLTVTIPLAWMGWGCWSLTMGSVCAAAANAAVLTVRAGWKPRLVCEPFLLKKMLSFSRWLLLESLSVWLTVWIDVIIVSRVFSSADLGTYKISTGMVNSIFGLIGTSVLPVLFSALSRLQGDQAAFQTLFLRFQKIAAVFVFPMGAGLWLYSDTAARLLLGEQWTQAAPVMGSWAVSTAVVMVFGHLCSEAYRAQGRPQLSLLAQLLHIAILIPVCIASAQNGWETFLFWRPLVRMQAVLVHGILMHVYIGIPIHTMLCGAVQPAAGMAAMLLTGLILRCVSDALAWQCLSAIICAAVYAGCLLCFPSMRMLFKSLCRTYCSRKGWRTEKILCE